MFIENKRSAHLQYINLPNLKNLLALKDVRKKVQQTARRCANKFKLLQLLNIRGMYDAIKKFIAPERSPI